MCIGIVSEFGVPMPDNDTLKRCWDGNSDGAGYAYLTEESQWQVKKGFMKWKDFINSFEEEKFIDENAVVIHFRIGTSGRCPHKAGDLGKGEMCTHPFPISDDVNELECINYISDGIVIHNGVVGAGAGVLSDTMIAIRDHISVLWKYSKTDQKVLELLEELIDCGPRYKGSRWFIGDKENHTLLGDWVLDKNTNLWYTHEGYKPIVTHRYPSGAYYNGYDDVWNMGYDCGNYEHLMVGSDTVGSIYILPNREAHEFMEASNWSWKKWEDKDGVESESTPVDTIREVYNSAGTDVIALVDSYGNVIWDDIIEVVPTTNHLNEDAILGDKSISCKNCGSDNMEERDLDDGKCPYCNLVLLSSTDEDLETTTSCPNCLERNHLGVSTFDIGDTECFRCGAVYLNTIIGTESIVTWNEDTKTRHEDLIQSAMDN